MSATRTISERQAVNAFLNHFNYVGANKKRPTNFAQRLFFNKALTSDLEADANTLKDTLESALNDTTLTNDALFEKFKAAIDTAFQTATTARDSRAVTEHGSTVPLVYTPDPASMMLAYDSTRQYHSHHAYKPRTFERELINGLNAATMHLDGDHKQYCESKVEDIKAFKPRDEYVTYSHNESCPKCG